MTPRNPSRGLVASPVRSGGQSGSLPPPLWPPDHLAEPTPAAPIGGFFPVIRRWAVVIAVATGIALLVGYALATSATPTYQAKAELLVGPLNADAATLRASSGATGTYAQLAGSPSILEAVARRTGVPRSLLYDGVRVTADPDTRILVVRARAHTADDAADVANGVAEGLIRQAADDSPDPAGRLRRIDVATPPSSPISPRVSVIVPLAAIGGLLAGLALVMVLELVGDAAGTVAEVGRSSGVPTLIVPSGTARRPPPVRGGAMVAAHLDLVRPDARSVLLAGTSGQDGVGRLALELAAAWAPPDERVVVVDAGGGEVSAVMGLEDRPGVAEALRGEVVAPTPVGPTVAVIGVGHDTRDAWTGLGGVTRLLDDLLTPGTRVVVHAAPTATGAGTLAWSRAVDVTVLVARRDAARRAQITEAAAALRAVGADLAFTILHAGGRKGVHLGVAPLADLRPSPHRTTEVVPA